MSNLKYKQVNPKIHYSCLQTPTEKKKEESFHFRCSWYVLTIPGMVQSCELTAQMTRKSPPALLTGRNVSWCSSVSSILLFGNQSNPVNSPGEQHLVKITDWLFFQGLQRSAVSSVSCKTLRCCHCRKVMPEITGASMILNMIIWPGFLPFFREEHS